MIKKVLSGVFVIFAVALLVGCGKDDTKNVKDEAITNNKAEITIYMPSNRKLDKKYVEDKSIAINYLPESKVDYTEKDVNQIVNNIDKHVKVLIISSEQNGLEGVFKKVKDKLPGVITIAANMNEFNNEKLNNILKNVHIDVGLDYSDKNNGVISVENAKLMGANKFVYLYLGDEFYSEDFYATEKICSDKGITFEPVKIDSLNFEDSSKEYLEKLPKKDIDKTAVFASSSKLSKIVLEEFKTKGFLVPMLNSGDDGKIFSEVFDIEHVEDKNIKAFKKSVLKKLSDTAFNGRLGMIYENTKNIPIEISIEIAKFMYEKNYMIEECYRDVSLVARGNEKLDLIIEPAKIGISSGYFRHLYVTPRIY